MPTGSTTSKCAEYVARTAAGHFGRLGQDDMYRWLALKIQEANQGGVLIAPDLVQDPLSPTCAGHGPKEGPKTLWPECHHVISRQEVHDQHVKQRSFALSNKACAEHKQTFAETCCSPL